MRRSINGIRINSHKLMREEQEENKNERGREKNKNERGREENKNESGRLRSLRHGKLREIMRTTKYQAKDLRTEVSHHTTL